MHSRVRTARRAFTLVELIAVIVVLSILAGVAVPKYFDHANRARTAATLGALGGVRTALASFLQNSAVTGTPAYPTAAQLAGAGTVLPQGLPRNPYNNASTLRTATAAQAAARTVSGTQGWAYYVNNAASPPTATFYCNSAATTTQALSGATSATPAPAGASSRTNYATANNL